MRCDLLHILCGSKLGLVYGFRNVRCGGYKGESNFGEPVNVTVTEMPAVSLMLAAEGESTEAEEETEQPTEWTLEPDKGYYVTLQWPGDENAQTESYCVITIGGSENSAGSLFADFRNAADFSDWNTIIYGHNMKNGSMFGTLSDYHEQAYYEAHPVWWLFTPEGAYRIELFAGYITAADAEAFSLLQTRAERDALAETARARSTFLSDLALNDEDRLITLSTCSYEFDTARYVLLGVLQKV